MAIWAAKKGIHVLGTGDFTHPAWRTELGNKLVPAEPGLFRLRDDIAQALSEEYALPLDNLPRFMLEVEISTIYKKGEKTRKVHHLIYVPDLDAADRLIQSLSRIGNLKADGRPILGLDSRNLLEITLESHPASYLIPAHIWTPWFAALGSKSGFDSIDDCYGDLTQHIFALETGLSSDPDMNRQLSMLDRYQLVSNSDAHSPGKIAREASFFQTDIDYFAIRHALETGQGYGGTVEFFPEEGKYHMDGCRACEVSLSPDQTLELKGLCPKCGKAVTVGVMHRVASLSDRTEPIASEQTKPFHSFVPLPEMLGEIEGVGPKSKKVQAKYEALLKHFDSELTILKTASREALSKAGSDLLAEAIMRMRAGKVHREAGYDGKYGVIRLFTDAELKQETSSGVLFDWPKSTPPSKPAPEKQQIAPATPSSQNLPTAKPTPPPSQAGLLGGLDPDQRAAAEIIDGPLLIIAGPGTGKTRTLTHRIAYLIAEQGVSPESCLALTFTQRAAAEMRERLQTLLPQQPTPPVMTFHGLGHLILRENHNLLNLPADVPIASEQERMALLVKALGVKAQRAKQLLSQISRLRCQPEGSAENPLREALTAYEQGLRQHSWVDFDDLIGLAVQLLENHPDLQTLYRQRYRWLSIDEYQDIDPRQYRLVKLLTPENENLCAIGDPDQAIYSFRGTDVGFFQGFTQDFPQAQSIALSRNYRSGKRIVEGALQLIRPASLVSDRQLEPQSPSMTKIVIHEAPSDRAEAEFVVHSIEKLIGGSTFFSIDSGRVKEDAEDALSFSDFAVLYRTEAQAAVLGEALGRSGIPFQKRSHEPLDEQATIIALMHALEQQEDTGPLTEQLGQAAAGLPDPEQGEAEWLLKTTLRPLIKVSKDNRDHLKAELALRSDVDLWDPRAERVSLLTLHAAKGLEFPVVFMVGCEQGLLPLHWGDAPIDKATLDEERRLFFVGMTRAERRLLLSHAKQRLIHGKPQKRIPSPFLKDLAETLLEAQASLAPKRKPQPTNTQLELF